ncbi:MAG: NADH-quinone oxidoreductase subunit NuoK [Myxococcota bacterium]
MTIGLHHFLGVAAILFCLGFYTVATRKNAVAILMGVELILNAANINFVAFSRYGDVAKPIVGQVFPVFGIMIAAAEAAVGLAIVLAIFQNWDSIDTEKTSSLKQ